MGELFRQLASAACEPGTTRGGRRRRDLQRVEERRHGDMPDAVSQVSRARVARVLAPGERVRAQVRLDLRACHAEHRLDPRSSPRSHARGTGETRAAREPHEQRLQLIIGGVGGGDRDGVVHARDSRQPPAPERAEPALAGEPAAAHPRGAIPLRRRHWDAEAIAEIGDEAQVGVGLASAEPVVEMRGTKLEPELGRQ